MTHCITLQRFMVFNTASSEDVTLSDKQQVVFNWLNDELRFPVYADVYKGAVFSLAKKSPGYITYVSHAGRDFMNELAATVKKMESVEVDNESDTPANGIDSARVQYVDLVGELQKVWNDKWGTEYVHAMDGTEIGNFVPFEVCERINDLIDDHNTGRERSDNLAPLFFTTLLDYADKERIPSNLLSEWTQTRRWFLAHAHLREGEFDTVDSDDLESRFRTLDDLLYVAASTEIERLRGINEILEETNE